MNAALLQRRKKLITRKRETFAWYAEDLAEVGGACRGRRSF
jgi:hypothetical protein